MRVVESILSFSIAGFIVRIWIQEEEVKEEYDHYELYTTIVKWHYDQLKIPEAIRKVTIKEVGEFIAGLPRVNAVEVRDPSEKSYTNSRYSTSRTLVIYNNWP